MYSSDMFDDKEMHAWEILDKQTWDNAKSHFFTLYKSKEEFNAEREACTGGYNSTNSVVMADWSRPFVTGSLRQKSTAWMCVWRARDDDKIKKRDQPE